MGGVGVHQRGDAGSEVGELERRHRKVARSRLLADRNSAAGIGTDELGDVVEDRAADRRHTVRLGRGDARAGNVRYIWYERSVRREP